MSAKKLTLAFWVYKIKICKKKNEKKKKKTRKSELCTCFTLWGKFKTDLPKTICLRSIPLCENTFQINNQYSPL